MDNTPSYGRVLNGEFHFDTVGPGTWTLSAHGDNQTLPVVAIAAGGSTVAGNQITVRDRAASRACQSRSPGSKDRIRANKDVEGAVADGDLIAGYGGTASAIATTAASGCRRERTCPLPGPTVSKWNSH